MYMYRIKIVALFLLLAGLFHVSEPRGVAGRGAAFATREMVSNPGPTSEDGEFEFGEKIV